MKHGAAIATSIVIVAALGIIGWSLTRRFTEKEESMDSRSIQSTRESRFWAWFSEKEELLAKPGLEGDQRALDEIEQQLNRVQKGLTFEVEFSSGDGGLREFVISSGGNQKLFPAIHSLVKAAPRLRKWKPVALKQRRPADLTVEFDDRVYTVEDYRYRSTPAGEGKLDVTLFVEGWNPAAEEALGSAGFLYLDLLLGEFDVESRLAAIDFQPLPKSAPNLKPLSKLVAEIDALKVELR